ncbi:alpha/beta hydrolase [Pseudoduganella namucuonensis]|uniref:Serine aminopeptidase S33 domain-containing protein n=1 Tax=Pseudoduganella namucuonensis TaxID=1035707 RepID=A0A1I7GX82_9BURK|nr:alpha/beta fold hydrolase [Pseudoduganella namucuonensis]SFU52896.1 hypothetical protein SAMN05216552_1004165 [Pseudoduganella namucuonensis]
MNPRLAAVLAFAGKLAALAALGYLGLCAALFVFQRSLIYMPPPASPVEGADVVALPVDGAELRVTVRDRQGARALVYFGGNAEDVNLGLPDLAAAFPERAIYLMHYRGYGGSTGSPTERALVADALVLFDKARARHGSVIVMGRSLGSGVAVQVASRRPVAGLVLVTPYDSVQTLAARLFGYIPVGTLLRDKFESWRYAPRVAAPTLILAAEHDEVIPRASTESLLASFPSPVATLRIVPGTGHNTISLSPEYVRLLRDFANR